METRAPIIFNLQNNWHQHLYLSSVWFGHHSIPSSLSLAVMFLPSREGAHLGIIVAQHSIKHHPPHRHEVAGLWSCPNSYVACCLCGIFSVGYLEFLFQLSLYHVSQSSSNCLDLIKDPEDRGCINHEIEKRCRSWKTNGVGLGIWSMACGCWSGDLQRPGMNHITHRTHEGLACSYGKTLL